MATNADTNRVTQDSSSGEATIPTEMSRRELKKERKRLAKKPQSSSNDAALEAIDVRLRQLRFEPVGFWAPTFVFVFFVMVAVFTTTLVEDDNSKSGIFLIPFFFLLLAAAVGFLDRNSGHPLKRIILSLVVVVILFIGFLLLTTIQWLADFAMRLFAFLAGNATLGTPGIANALANWLGDIGVVGPPLQVIVLITGAIVFFGLVILVPGLLLSLLFQEITYRADPSVSDTLILLGCVLVAFLLPVGLSIIGNLGI